MSGKKKLTVAASKSQGQKSGLSSNSDSVAMKQQQRGSLSAVGGVAPSKTQSGGLVSSIALQGGAIALALAQSPCRLSKSPVKGTTLKRHSVVSSSTHTTNLPPRHFPVVLHH